MRWLPVPPGTTVGARSAVMVGANDPTFCFSVGVNGLGDCGALLPVGAWVSAGFSVVSLPQAVMGAMPTTAVAAAATKAAGEVGVTTEILSPLAGTLIALSDVPDPVFGKGIMGPGIAVEPSGDIALAPGAGTVIAAQPTGHAYGILLDTGVEVLIHVGLDTVKLKGEGFDIHVAKGDRVVAGTPLVTFDRAVIEKAGYPLITPIVVLNAKKFGSVEMAGAGEIAPGEPIITVKPAPQPVEAGL